MYPGKAKIQVEHVYPGKDSEEGFKERRNRMIELLHKVSAKLANDKIEKMSET